MRLTHIQYQEMLARTMRNSKRSPAPAPSKAVEMEMDLHRQIMDFCDKAWPRWKYIRARSDQRSTIQLGAQDFTLFLPGGKVLCIECKRKGSKLSEDQIIWKKEMEMLGHVVHTVYSFEEFERLIK